MPRQPTARELRIRQGSAVAATLSPSASSRSPNTPALLSFVEEQKTPAGAGGRGHLEFQHTNQMAAVRPADNDAAAAEGQAVAIIHVDGAVEIDAAPETTQNNRRGSLFSVAL